MYVGRPVDAWEGNTATDRGAALEEQAIALYEFMTGATIERVGFVTDDEGAMGCSPDGLIGDGGMLEIKSPKAKHHLEAMVYHHKHGKCPPKFVQQTQGQLLVCGRKWVDLLFYHPELPPLIIRQTPDPEIQAAIREAVKNVIADRDMILSVMNQREAA